MMLIVLNNMKIEHVGSVKFFQFLSQIGLIYLIKVVPKHCFVKR